MEIMRRAGVSKPCRPATRGCIPNAGAHEVVRRRQAGRGPLMTGTSAAAKLDRSTFAENHFLQILYDFVWLAAALCRRLRKSSRARIPSTWSYGTSGSVVVTVYRVLKTDERLVRLRRIGGF